MLLVLLVLLVLLMLLSADPAGVFLSEPAAAAEFSASARLKRDESEDGFAALYQSARGFSRSQEGTYFLNALFVIVLFLCSRSFLEHGVII